MVEEVLPSRLRWRKLRFEILERFYDVSLEVEVNSSGRIERILVHKCHSFRRIMV